MRFNDKAYKIKRSFLISKNCEAITLSTNLTYYGHAAFMVTHNDTSLLFDPFLTGNTWNVAKPEDIKCQYIFVSHGHDDHYGDTAQIAKANKALVISTAEMAHKAEEDGCQVHAMHLGGKFDFPFGSLRLVPAFHGAGVAGGHAAGALVDFFGTKIYFAGDTALFSDMKLLDRFGQIDYAFLPIGDNFTMGPEDALIAANYINARVTIPIHYKTWPVIDADPNQFVKDLKDKYQLKGRVVEPGITIPL